MIGPLAEAGGSGLAAPALAAQGIPQPMGMGIDSAPDAAAISELMAMLKGGQVGAEKFMQLLSLLASATVPTMDPGPEQGMLMDPMMEEMMMAQGGGPAPMGPPPMGGGGSPSIEQLLMGGMI